MKSTVSVLTLLAMSAAAGCAQVSGNITYSQSGGSARAAQSERARRTITRDEMPPGSSTFVEASVLMNVKADEYVAVFGIAQEGATVTECSQKMDSVIREFSTELKSLGIAQKDIYVDFVAQNKIYGYEVTGEVAREKLTGFELKKSIAIHYRDKTLLDRLILAGSRSQIFDLIKVDYLVKDTSAVHDRLMTEASRVIKRKAARYERLLGIKLKSSGQVYAERGGIHYPGDLYDSYMAFESEDVSAGYYRQKYLVQGARKSRTFYFNGLTAAGFDYVINPVVIEPVVQFTLYLKVKYDRAASGAPAGRAASKKSG